MSVWRIAAYNTGQVMPWHPFGRLNRCNQCEADCVG